MKPVDRAKTAHSNSRLVYEIDMLWLGFILGLPDLKIRIFVLC